MLKLNQRRKNQEHFLQDSNATGTVILGAQGQILQPVAPSMVNPVMAVPVTPAGSGGGIISMETENDVRQ